jgi:hypothetical protein
MGSPSPVKALSENGAGLVDADCILETKQRPESIRSFSFAPFFIVFAYSTAGRMGNQISTGTPAIPPDDAFAKG